MSREGRTSLLRYCKLCTMYLWPCFRFMTQRAEKVVHHCHAIVRYVRCICGLVLDLWPREQRRWYITVMLLRYVRCICGIVLGLWPTQKVVQHCYAIVSYVRRVSGLYFSCVTHHVITVCNYLFPVSAVRQQWKAVHHYDCSHPSSNIGKTRKNTGARCVQHFKVCSHLPV